MGKLYFLCDYFKSKKPIKSEIQDGGFEDSYNMSWLLKDDNGKEWVEYYQNISLSDFEEIYGNNVYTIIMIEMRLCE